MKIVRIILQAVNVLSFIGLILVWILGTMYEVLGHGRFEQMLSAIGIHNGFEITWILSAILLLALLVSYLLKTKLNKKT